MHSTLLRVTRPTALTLRSAATRVGPGKTHLALHASLVPRLALAGRAHLEVLSLDVIEEGLRKPTVEAVSGQIKHGRGLTQLLWCGVEKVAAESNSVGTAHNFPNLAAAGR